MSANEAGEGSADREILVRRTIDGPRHLVFRAWTDPDHLAQWWGPHGFTTTTRSFDFRVGGVWEFLMHGPDGTDFPNRVQYREIVPPERIVYTQGQHANDPEAFVSSVSFEARGDTTEITLRTTFATKAQRDAVVERFGALEGAHQTLQRLDDYVGTLRADVPGSVAT